MINKETIKKFLKPTGAKIGFTFLIFIGVIFLVNIFPAFIGNHFFFPSFEFICNPLQDCLDRHYLNSVPERIKNNLSAEELVDIGDNWIPVFFLCVLPLRIIYYYIFACLIIVVAKKLKRRKK